MKLFQIILTVIYFCALSYATECPADNDPNFVVHLPHEYDCTKFYKCDWGNPVLMDCPANLHWSVADDRCEHEDLANCNLSGSTIVLPEITDSATDPILTTLGSESTTQNTESSSQQPDPSSGCPPENDPNFVVHLPHEYDCTKFYKCDWGIPVLMDCPANLHWSVAADRCEHEELANCDLSGSTIVLPEITDSATDPILTTLSSDSTTQNTESSSQHPGPSSDCPPDDSGPVVHLPHDDCTKFYKCSNGIAHVFDCPSGLHWSIKMDRCEWPYIAECDPSATIPPEMTATAEITMLPPQNTLSVEETSFTVPTTDIETSPPIDSRCPAENPARPLHFSHENDCTLFYICNMGVAVLYACPQGLHFSIFNERCELPHVAECNLPRYTTVPQELTVATTESSTVEPTTQILLTPTSTLPAAEVTNPGIDSRCPLANENPPTHLPHETECGLFYICDRGMPVLMTCPGVLHWSIVVNRCERPEDANCEL